MGHEQRAVLDWILDPSVATLWEEFRHETQQQLVPHLARPLQCRNPLCVLGRLPSSQCHRQG